MVSRHGAALAAAVVVMLVFPGFPAAWGQQSGSPQAAQPVQGPPMLRFKCGEFDPLQSTPPIPPQMRLSVSQGVYIVQFDGPIYARQTLALSRLAAIVAYIPDYAYVVFAGDDAVAAIRSVEHVRYVGLFEPGYKVSPSLGLGAAPVELTVLCFRGDDLPAAADGLEALGAVVLHRDPLAIRASAPGAAALLMAFIPQVQWIEQYNAPQVDNGNAARITKVRSSTNGPYNWGTNSLWSYNNVTKKYEGYAGANFTAAVADTGIDGTHPAFSGKKMAYYAYGGTDWYDYYGSVAHGTHTAGTVLGNGGWRNETNPGPSYGIYAGMAPLAGLVGQMIAGWCTYYDLCHDAFQSGAVTSSNSWGGGAGGSYDASASEYDYLVRDSRADQDGNQSLTVVFSAGNSGPGGGTIDPPSTAKNVISVGATDDSSGNSIADFSSRGPCDDGRIKPDIMAPGVNVNSARGNSGNSYHTMSGTSMSCPVVAGATLVVNEYYCITRGSRPSPAMVKNILINGADPMSGQTYPGANQGWGRLNVAKSLLNTTSRKIWMLDQGEGLSTGVATNYGFNITGAGELKISLVWTDVNATPGASRALVNDLDLRVTAPNGTLYIGNFFNSSFTAVNGTSDFVNNVEVVRIAAPAGGMWRVSVKGRNVPLGPQDFTLVIGGPIANVTKISINLAAADLAFLPPDPAEGELVTMSGSVANLGQFPETAVNWRFSLTDQKGIVKYLPSEPLPLLPVGGSLPVSANWTAIRGCYTVALEVDPFSVVTDDRMDDNIASANLKVRGFGLGLSGPAEINVDPGRSNDFQIVLSNLANTVDNFTLSIDPGPKAGWSAGLQSPAIQAQEAQNITFTAFVTPPATEWAGNFTTLRIRAVSEGNGTYSATVQLAAHVNFLHAVNVSLSGADVWVFPGVLATVPLSLENSGNGQESSISLSLSGVPLGWQASLSDELLSVPRFSSSGFSVLVMSPANAPGLSVASFDVRAAYAGKTASTTVTVHVRQVPDILLELADGPDSEDPGGNASYVLRVRNRGNGPDPFGMAADLPKGWIGRFSDIAPVATGDFVLVDFILSIPANAPTGEEEFSLTAVSGIDANVSSTVRLSITVNQVFGVELSSDETRTEMDIGNTTKFYATIKNTGNGDDTIFFESADALPAGWRIIFMPPLVNLPAGGATSLVIKVRSGANSTAGGYFFTVRATSSGDSYKMDAVKFRIDLVTPPPPEIIPPVNNTGPPTYTGPPPAPEPDRWTRYRSSWWFFPAIALALVVLASAGYGAYRVRRRRRIEEERLAAARYEPPPEEEVIETVEMTAPPPRKAPPPVETRRRPPAPPPEVARPEPVAIAAASPNLRSEAYESEMATVDMGPAVDISKRGAGAAPGAKGAARPPAKPLAPEPAPRPGPKKLAAKNVDSEIEDILARIDGIAGKKP